MSRLSRSSGKHLQIRIHLPLIYLPECHPLAVRVLPRRQQSTGVHSMKIDALPQTVTVVTLQTVLDRLAADPASDRHGSLHLRATQRLHARKLVRRWAWQSIWAPVRQLCTQAMHSQRCSSSKLKRRCSRPKSTAAGQTRNEHSSLTNNLRLSIPDVSARDHSGIRAISW